MGPYGLFRHFPQDLKMKPIYILSLLAKNLLNHNKKDCYLKTSLSVTATIIGSSELRDLVWAQLKRWANGELWTGPVKASRAKPPPASLRNRDSLAWRPPCYFFFFFLSKLFQLALIPKQFSSFKTIFIHSHQLTLKKKSPATIHLRLNISVRAECV